MKVLKISSKNFKEIAKTAMTIIKKGGVIICPTDTIYGLVADAQNKKAIKKIFKIKKRKNQKALPIFVKDVKMAKELARISREQEIFLRKIWPGEVTVILKRKKDCKLPKILFGGTETIGLRIPKYELVNVLVRKLNRPLTGTSANISGKPGSNKIRKILNQFKNHPTTTSRTRRPGRVNHTRSGGGQPDLVINAGNLKKNKPSTIVDLTKSELKLLRTGELSKKELLRIYGCFYLPKN